MRYHLTVRSANDDIILTSKVLSLLDLIKELCSYIGIMNKEDQSINITITTV